MDNFPAEKRLSENSLIKKRQTALKSLNNYLNQLNIHFDLNDEDVVKILESVIKTRKKNIFKKKWWHLSK